MGNEKKEKASSVFRQKSIDKVTSPEDLNSIIKVTNPGIWILIIAIIALLCGALVWGFLGKLETKVAVALQVKENSATVYVKENDIEHVKKGQDIKFDNCTCKVETISEKAQKGKDLITDEYVVHLLGLTDNDWIYVVTSTVTAKDGMYGGNIITESVTPISFIFN